MVLPGTRTRAIAICKSSASSAQSPRHPQKPTPTRAGMAAIIRGSRQTHQQESSIEPFEQASVKASVRKEICMQHPGVGPVKWWAPAAILQYSDPGRASPCISLCALCDSIQKNQPGPDQMRPAYPTHTADTAPSTCLSLSVIIVSQRMTHRYRHRAQRETGSKSHPIPPGCRPSIGHEINWPGSLPPSLPQILQQPPASQPHQILVY